MVNVIFKSFLNLSRCLFCCCLRFSLRFMDVIQFNVRLLRDFRYVHAKVTLLSVLPVLTVTIVIFDLVFRYTHQPFVKPLK